MRNRPLINMFTPGPAHPYSSVNFNHLGEIEFINAVDNRTKF